MCSMHARTMGGAPLTSSCSGLHVLPAPTQPTPLVTAHHLSPLQVLTYLNDVEEGGETTFPNIPAVGATHDLQIERSN